MQTKIIEQRAANLHTHSFYCGHGNGTIASYVQEAQRAQLSLLGFSEHCPVYDGRWHSSRMEFSSMNSYEADCEQEKQKASGSPLTILTGYECDYLKGYHSYFEDLKQRVDYLICGVHDLSTDLDQEYSVFYNDLSKQDLFRYTDLYCQALESGLFLFGAHPDVFAHSYPKWDAEAKAASRAIIECAVSNNVALEINANGMRKRKVESESGLRYAYPLVEFWRMAGEYPLKVVTNSDAHESRFLVDRQEECFAFARQCSVQFSSYLLQDIQGKRSITLA